MGFFTDIFKSKAEPTLKKEQVNVTDLSTWFSKISKEQTETVLSELQAVFSDLRSSRQDLTRELLLLEKAELENDDIPVKEKQFMEGNRLNYCKKAQDFIESTKIGERHSLKEIKEYALTHNHALGDFTRQTARSFHICNQFFGNEMNEISASLKDIEDSVKKMQELLSEKKVSKTNELQEAIEKLNEILAQRDKMHADLEHVDEEYESLKTLKADYSIRLSKIKKDPSYEDLMRLQSEKAKAETELKMLKSSFINEFSQIEKALKKFAKIDDEFFISRYVDDPISAILADPDLKILPLITRLNGAVNQNQIELEDKKREKILERLQQIDKKYLVNFIIAHNDWQLKIEELKRMMKKNTSSTEHDDLQYKIDHVQNKQEQYSGQIGKLNTAIERLDIESQLKNIGVLAKEFNREIEVIL